MLQDDEPAVCTVCRGGTGNHLTVGSSIDLAGATVDVNSDMVVTVAGTVGVATPAHVGVGSPGAVGVVHGHAQTRGGSGTANTGAGGIAAQSQLVPDAGNLVIGAAGNGVHGGIVGLAANIMGAQFEAGIARGDGAVGCYAGAGGHAIGGVLGGAGVGLNTDCAQAEDVVGVEPAGTIAGAGGVGGIGHIDGPAVIGDFGNDDLILERIDVVASGLGTQRCVGVAVYLGCTGQGHGVCNQRQAGAELRGDGGVGSCGNGGSHGGDCAEAQDHSQDDSNDTLNGHSFHVNTSCVKAALFLMDDW